MNFKIFKMLMVWLALTLSFCHCAPLPASCQQADRDALLVKAYTSQIGVREATGKNDGKAVEMYLRTVGLGKGYAWCAAFVKWCLNQAGILNTLNGMALTAHNKYKIVYYKNQWHTTAKPGNVFTIYYASLKRIGHTGFFHRQINSSVYETVEGNTNEAGGREGDGVYKKKRSFNATYSITSWYAENKAFLLNGSSLKADFKKWYK